MDNPLQLVLWQAFVVSSFMLLWSISFLSKTLAAYFEPTFVVTGMILLLCLWVVLAAVLGVFVSSWWAYTGLCAVLLVIFLFLAVLLHTVFNASAWESVGPGAIGYMAPLLVFICLNPLGGLVRLILGLLRS